MESSGALPLRAVTTLVCSEHFPEQVGPLPHVAYLIDRYLDDDLDQRVFTAACKRGASDGTLDFFLSLSSPDWEKAVNVATQYGHLRVLQWMRKKESEGRGPWKSDFRDALEEAAAFGHLDIAKWLFDSGLAQATSRMMNRAAGNGHFEVLKWCYEYFPESFSTSAMEDAAANGHLHILQWLNDRHPGLQSRNLFCRAARNGHIEVLQWLYTNRPESWSEDAIVQAVYSGNMEMIMWLSDYFPNRFSSSVIDRAASVGQLEIVKWLHEHRTEGCTTSAMDEAACEGHLETVKWLHEHRTEGCTTSAMNGAAYYGHLETIKWLHEHRTEGCTTSAMNGAACEGHLEIIKWLHEHRTENCTVRAMNIAAGKGHLKVVQWLHANRLEGCTTNAMDWAAESGHLSVVRWLHENRSEGCTINAMEQAAMHGHIEVVKFLHRHRTEGCRDNFYVMSEVVSNGHLAVVRFLHDNNRNRYFGQQLRDAVDRGHLEAIQVKLLQTDRSHFRILHGYVIVKAFTKMLDQIPKSCKQHTRNFDENPIVRRSREGLEWFHIHGFDGCVSRMLQLAVERGYPDLANSFLEHKPHFIFYKHVDMAAKYCRKTLLRWLLSNGPQLELTFAVDLVKKYDYVEVVWGMPESHRSSIVCDAICEEWPKWKEVVSWILDKTSFEQLKSYREIRDAIGKAPPTTVQWLRQNVANKEFQELEFLDGTN